jgi:pyruvate dehydrogenase E1 component
MNQNTDKIQNESDPQETQEWLESLQAVIEREGPERAHYLIEQLVDYTRRSGGYLPYKATTAYINTIPPHLGARHPRSEERRVGKSVDLGGRRSAAHFAGSRCGIE